MRMPRLRGSSSTKPIGVWRELRAALHLLRDQLASLSATDDQDLLALRQHGAARRALDHAAHGQARAADQRDRQQQVHHRHRAGQVVVGRRPDVQQRRRARGSRRRPLSGSSRGPGGRRSATTCGRGRRRRRSPPCRSPRTRSSPSEQLLVARRYPLVEAQQISEPDRRARPGRRRRRPEADGAGTPGPRATEAASASAGVYGLSQRIDHGSGGAGVVCRAHRQRQVRARRFICAGKLDTCRIGLHCALTMQRVLVVRARPRCPPLSSRFNSSSRRSERTTYR